MPRNLFQSQMEHIASGMYWSARNIKAHNEFMSTILADEPIDEVSIDDLTQALIDISEYSDVMSRLADEVMHVCYTYQGILECVS